MDQLEITNYALGALGLKRLSSLSESSNLADKCAVLYENSLDMVLRQHTWASTVERLSLGEITLPSHAPFQYAYELPNDLVRALDLVPEENSLYFENYLSRFKYKIEGNTLYTSESPAILRYVKRPTGDIRDPLLCRCIAYDMAIYLAVDESNNEGKQQRMIQMYQTALQQAKNIASDEGENPHIGDDYWYGQFPYEKYWYFRR